MTRTLFANARLATMADADGIGFIEDGALLVEGDRIAWLGLAREATAAERTFDCRGRLLTPGLIDCHTHLIHAGSRAKEFEMRLEGATYAEIARAGLDPADEPGLVEVYDDVVMPSGWQESGGQAELAFRHGLVPLRRKV